MADMDKHVAHAVLIFAGVLRPDSQEEDMTEQEHNGAWEDNYVYRFQYSDGSAFQIYEDGRYMTLRKDAVDGDCKLGIVINRIPTRIAQAAQLGHDEAIQTLAELSLMENSGQYLKELKATIARQKAELAVLRQSEAALRTEIRQELIEDMNEFWQNREGGQ